MVVCVILLIREIKDERNKCIKEPFVYGIQGIERTTGNDLTCQCYLDSKPGISIIVTRDGYKPFLINDETKNSGINFSKLVLE